ncbi:hypothetical protein H2509_00085 [Stappia sp. F7233]|uniref:Uncharacterized protein n=1 Tax=Stappia albiluteola TaxID=2758565 RepID=A0A839A8Y6_9HYPH|nr:DUF5676 family membrane protein [Stappia albiluteola]MBA5775518.1 hypothetical protein [Stappia albiluteola]
MAPIIYFAAVAAVLFIALRFACGDCVMGRRTAGNTHLIPMLALGWALSLFLAITYLVCVTFDLLFPSYAMYETWARLLPGFVWLTPAGFAIGLIESFVYGWYAALIFAPLYNWYSSRWVR